MHQLDKVELRGARLSRQVFSGENSGTSINVLHSHQQANRNFSPPPTMPILSSAEKAAKMELEAVLRKPAYTAEEK